MAEWNCNVCSRPVVDKRGKPDFRKHVHDECQKTARKNKLAAKRERQRAEVDRRVKAEMKRCCKDCPRRSEE
jgi:hypothetical protein